MKLREYLQEEKGTEQMVQRAFDKAHADINKGTDTPVKKNSPITQIQNQLGLEESNGTTRKIKIEIDMIRQGTNDAMTYEQVEKIISNGFKQLKTGTSEKSGKGAYVNLYDDSRDIKVGSLEVK